MQPKNNHKRMLCIIISSLPHKDTFQENRPTAQIANLHISIAY